MISGNPIRMPKGKQCLTVNVALEVSWFGRMIGLNVNGLDQSMIVSCRRGRAENPNGPG
jgi:hypothetical protein